MGSGLDWLKKRNEARKADNAVYKEEYDKRFAAAKQQAIRSRAQTMANSRARHEASSFGISRMERLSLGLERANKSMGNTSRRWEAASRGASRSPVIQDIFGLRPPKTVRKRHRIKKGTKKTHRKKGKTIIITL